MVHICAWTSCFLKAVVLHCFSSGIVGCKKYAARVCNSLPHILCLASLVFRRGLFGSFKRGSLRSGRWRLKLLSRYHHSSHNKHRRIPWFVSRCRVPHA